MLLDVILDTLLDGLRLLPFLFFTYLLMEFLEHRTGEAGRVRIGAARRSGPVWGALFGIIPQCGFSAAASGLYAGRVITMGTLMAIYLSTSDEMLPILISSAVSLPRILRILAVKVGIAIITGLLIDMFMKDHRGHLEDDIITTMIMKRRKTSWTSGNGSPSSYIGGFFLYHTDFLCIESDHWTGWRRDTGDDFYRASGGKRTSGGAGRIDS